MDSGTSEGQTQRPGSSGEIPPTMLGLEGSSALELDVIVEVAEGRYLEPAGHLLSFQ